MVSVVRFIVVLIPLIFSLAALVLGALACAGSTKNASPINHIYEFKLDMTEVDITKLITKNTILGAFTSLSGVTISGSDIGLSDMYTIGQWGYCKGDYDDGEYKPSKCSDPQAMYVFDPVKLLVEDLTSGTLDITSDDLSLPESVENNRKQLKIASKAIFITTIIGIVASALTFLFTIASFCSHIISFISTIFAIIAFLGYVIAAAASTAAFNRVKTKFNDAYSEYGMKGTLDNNRFYGLIWAATGLALIVVVLEVLAICCGRTKKKSSKEAKSQTPPSPNEKEPFMGYQERQVV
ncbi:putative membrane protein [Wickerhamomyces ciferrii]|uniref:Membrane protein n=1 Tax=Wickerhamomyces ciferrii (strain ATCC 14091 / BCRC 22168 / CBS 111 / JCM 3599 / NBRC 0793 / NRRL Y-1031 F-60-10) TaxID=1206466 RepID=K0KXJ8_WICCF|nr:uncharacterized protein BN7_5344 [Wickerhamomyces ciferrii]CCH45758.1 putative membrane protein [Wickerhamomyces ciferrii]